MRHAARRSFLPLLFLTLVSCDEGGPSPVDSPVCGSLVGVQTLLVTTIPTSHTPAGTLADGDCVLARGAFGDRYLLDIRVPVNLELIVGSTDFNAYLYVRTKGDNPLAADDNSGPGSDARISFFFPADTYYVFATSYPKNVTGAYTLTMNATTPVP